MEKIKDLFLSVKDTIMYHPSLKILSIAGLLSLACIIIYLAGKCTGEFIATIMK